MCKGCDRTWVYTEKAAMGKTEGDLLKANGRLTLCVPIDGSSMNEVLL